MYSYFDQIERQEKNMRYPWELKKQIMRSFYAQMLIVYRLGHYGLKQ